MLMLMECWIALQPPEGVGRQDQITRASRTKHVRISLSLGDLVCSVIGIIAHSPNGADRTVIPGSIFSYHFRTGLVAIFGYFYANSQEPR
jgi:hypothetical protein